MYMAVRIGIKDLQATLTATIRRVRQGETFEITHHGEPVALLGPVPGDSLEQLIRAGAARRARPPLDLRSLRPRPGSGPTSASEALEQDRSGV
jgi:prevent-host-death family protein